LVYKIFSKRFSHEKVLLEKEKKRKVRIVLSNLCYTFADFPGWFTEGSIEPGEDSLIWDGMNGDGERP